MRSENRQLQSRLKSVVSLERMNKSDANREVEQLKKDKENLTTEVGGLKTKTDKLESYLEQLAAKLVLKLEGMISRLQLIFYRLNFVVMLSTHHFLQWDRTVSGL